MKFNSILAFTTASVLTLAVHFVHGQDHIPFIDESPVEFFGTGDFDGDGLFDIVIVDKETGKFRLAYQTAAGTLSWVDCRLSGIKLISGFTIGRLFTNSMDAMAFTSPDSSQISLVGAPSSTAPSRPKLVPFEAALGPNMLLAIDIGGEGNNNLSDLYVGSIYNSFDPNLATLLRNDGAAFPKIAEVPLSGPATRGNRLPVKTSQPDLACFIVTDDKGATLRAENVATGKPLNAATVSGLPKGSDLAVGKFGGASLPQIVVYKPGENTFSFRPLEEQGAGQFRFGNATSFDLGRAIRKVVTIENKSGPKLFVIFGEGDQGGVFNFDGLKPPILAQTIIATNELLTSAASVQGGFVAFSHPAGTKFSTRYHSYKAAESGYEFSAFGGLPSLADNDNITIPDIHDRLLSNSKIKTEAEMKAYTNTIPGTLVNFVMLPIPGGEFTMGSAESESGRKPDEGPQHKVKISPFWMGQCEVTWNEYELFMYPDEERRTRATTRTDPAGDKLADAVTHPSRPYVEMSFGMGKDNFPAISMTQHGANKYCQWLSAKTGEFYRLPTEAEWEYACRAGTTTPYFFGTDASKLPDYAWFEQNSDFKYQKIRKKKPNPWGLYDIYGNVVEWVLDQYDPEFYKQSAANGTSIDPWKKATKPYPHAVRGGSWDDEAGMCRSATRRGSDRAWKMQDPQLPKSVWYHSDAQWVGFRIVRPLKVPAPEELQKYWTSGVERD